MLLRWSVEVLLAVGISRVVLPRQLAHTCNEQCFDAVSVDTVQLQSHSTAYRWQIGVGMPSFYLFLFPPLYHLVTVRSTLIRR